MVDYVKFQNLAKRLIDANGRAINIVQTSRVNSDEDKPWRSSDEISDTVAIIGAFFDSNKSFISKTLLENHQSSVLVNALDSGDKDLSEYDQIIDGDFTYGIDKVDILKPGDLTVLYEFIVSR